MAKQYASLIGPLLGLYYPLPFNDQAKNRLALSTSRLKDLWCSVYNEQMTDKLIADYGGKKLDDSYVQKLDYDSHEVSKHGP